MAAMYLLQHPDHYTNHKFRPCFWRGYIYEIMRAWSDSLDISEEGTSKVVVGLAEEETQGKTPIVPLSPVLDYVWRPPEYENVCVYDWVRLYHKKAIPKSEKKTVKPQMYQPLHDDSDFENDYNIVENEHCALDHNDQDEVEPAYYENEVAHPEESLYGGAHPDAEEEEESEDKLLLTKESNHQLNEEIKVEQIIDQQTRSQNHKPQYLIFHAQHPQARTHHVILMDEKDGYEGRVGNGSSDGQE